MELVLFRPLTIWSMNDYFLLDFILRLFWSFSSSNIMIDMSCAFMKYVVWCTAMFFDIISEQSIIGERIKQINCMLSYVTCR